MRALWPAIVVLLGCAAEPRVEPPPPIPPVSSTNNCIELNPLDFGEVEVGDRSDLQFTITNFTVRPVFVTVGRVNAPFQVSASGEFQLEPGESLPLRVSFLPRDGRLHLGTLPFIGGRECEPQAVSLRGLGAGGLIAEPATLQVGHVPFDVVTRRSIKLRNTRRQPVVVTASTFSSFLIDPLTFTLPALGEAPVEIGIAPGAGGLASGDVIFTSDRGDRTALTIFATAGAPKVELESASLEVPFLALGGATSPVTRTILVRNLGAGPLELSDFEVVSTAGSANEVQLSVPFTTLVTDAAMLMTVRIVPALPVGPRAWELRFTTNESDGQRRAIPVTGTVLAIPACDRVTARVPFPTAAPTELEVSLLNESPEPCLLDDVRLENPTSWSTSAPRQLALEGGESVTVRVNAPTTGSNVLRFNAVGSPFQPVGFTAVTLEAR